MGLSAFLVGLADDLQARCDRLIKMAKASGVRLEIAQFAENTVVHLSTLRDQIKAFQASNRLLYDKIASEAFQEYQALEREVVMIEHFALPALVRFNDQDQQMLQSIERLIRETGFPKEIVSLVNSTSFNYYWAKPELQIIGIPSGDVEGVLGWPDLLHELSHNFLYLRPTFLDKFAPMVKEFFRRQRDEAHNFDGGQQNKKWLRNAKTKWEAGPQGTWQLEMAANMIATFLCGPSFGWQHLRLCVNHSKNPFSPSPMEPLTDHPAYHAQLDGICAMLSLLGYGSDGEAIKQQWLEILNVIATPTPPQGYSLYYPNTLIKELAQVVHDNCAANGLIKFSANTKSQTIAMIAQAWNVFLADPQHYSEWEKQISR